HDCAHHAACYPHLLSSGRNLGRERSETGCGQTHCQKNDCCRRRETQTCCDTRRCCHANIFGRRTQETGAQNRQQNGSDQNRKQNCCQENTKQDRQGCAKQIRRSLQENCRQESSRQEGSR